MLISMLNTILLKLNSRKANFKKMDEIFWMERRRSKRGRRKEKEEEERKEKRSTRRWKIRKRGKRVRWGHNMLKILRIGRYDNLNE